MTRRENWLKLIHDDNPGWIGLPWEAFRGNFFYDIFVSDPILMSIFPDMSTRDTPQKDGWGVTWKWPSGTVAPNPYITSENRVLKDVSRWQEVVKFPPLDGHNWQAAKEFAASVDRSEYLTMCFVIRGLFERTHLLMGFEDALSSYMLNPQAMYDLLGAIADWKIGHIERIIDNIQPDVIHYHDDWGSKSNLFLPPNVWRELIKPHQKRIVQAAKSKGMIFMHHADCICEPIVDDMAEIGIDIWQGVIPQNDILRIQGKLRGRMALMGGIDAHVIEQPDISEESIRNEVRRCIDTYCPNGHMVPCIPNIVPIIPEAAEIYNDELADYGRSFFHSR